MEAWMNDEADYYALLSQNLIHLIPKAPLPTFHMNEYTFFHEIDRWMESNIAAFVDSVMVHEMVLTLGIGNRH